MLVQEKHPNPCFQFLGEVSNQLSAKSITKDLLSSPFFFLPLPALALKNLQIKFSLIL